MSLRRLVAAGVVVGMLATAATGCSANTPERNQGNRNGQRVADAVNRRPDSYTGRTNRGLFGGRTINRTARNTETRARGMADDFGSRTLRTANRSTLGRPQARIGNTFRYGPNRNHSRRLDGNRYEMNRTDRGVSGTSGMTGMNRAARRASSNGVNRAERRANSTTGVALANTDTVPVFFNKKQEAPQQETAPTPEVAPVPSVQ
ncbi:MAG: hypothetical protein FWF77_03290 [Defluviitaleaceae bacterium]|nr:hypothetical protein [Defluviitaleaceae bacterium]